MTAVTTGGDPAATSTPVGVAPRRGRPIQPSIRKQVAQLLATLDPRCDMEREHTAAIEQATACPYCRRNLWDYLTGVPDVWPGAE